MDTVRKTVSLGCSTFVVTVTQEASSITGNDDYTGTSANPGVLSIVDGEGWTNSHSTFKVGVEQMRRKVPKVMRLIGPSRILNCLKAAAPAILCGLLLAACSSKNGQSSASQSGPVPTPSAPMTANSAPSASPAPASQSTPAAAAPVPSHEHLAGIGSATVVTVHGKVVSVDRAKKLVTLEGPRGKQVTLEVKNPYNLEAAKPGEPFVAKFYEIVTIRKKRPGETLPAVTLAEGIVSAVPGQTPGAVVGSSVQVVATIVAINKKKKTVDIQGPDGVVETVNVANPANLKLAKVGSEFVITLTKVTAISLAHEPTT